MIENSGRVFRSRIAILGVSMLLVVVISFLSRRIESIFPSSPRAMKEEIRPAETIGIPTSLTQSRVSLDLAQRDWAWWVLNPHAALLTDPGGQAVDSVLKLEATDPYQQSYRTVPVVPNGVYTLSVSVRNNVRNPNTMIVALGVGSADPLGLLKVQNVNDEWKQYSLLFQVPPRTKQAIIRLSNGSAGMFYWKDVWLQGPSPVISFPDLPRTDIASTRLASPVRSGDVVLPLVSIAGMKPGQTLLLGPTFSPIELGRVSYVEASGLHLERPLLKDLASGTEVHAPDFRTVTDQERQAVENLKSEYQGIAVGNKATVSFRSDHTPETICSTVAPLMQDHGFPWLIAVNSAALDQLGVWDRPGVCPTDRIRQIQMQGAMIANHGREHLYPYDFYDDIVETHQELNGLRLWDRVWVAPGVGEPQPMDLPVQGDGYLDKTYQGWLIRRTYGVDVRVGGNWRSLPSTNQYEYVNVETAKLADLKRSVDLAVQRRTALVLGGHYGLIGGSGYLSVNDFRSLLDYVAEKRETGLLEVLSLPGTIFAQHSGTWADLISQEAGLRKRNVPELPITLQANGWISWQIGLDNITTEHVNGGQLLLRLRTSAKCDRTVALAVQILDASRADDLNLTRSVQISPEDTTINLPFTVPSDISGTLTVSVGAPSDCSVEIISAQLLKV